MQQTAEVGRFPIGSFREVTLLRTNFGCSDFRLRWLQSYRLTLDRPVAGDRKTKEFENVTTRPVGCWVPLSISAN